MCLLLMEHEADQAARCMVIVAPTCPRGPGDRCLSRDIEQTLPLFTAERRRSLQDALGGRLALAALEQGQFTCDPRTY